MSDAPAGRVKAALDLLRPRTFFRTLSRVDPLVDLTRDLAVAVQALQIRTEQLLTIQRLDWEQREEVATLNRWLDTTAIDVHVSAAVGAATLQQEPFPHIVVEPLLPRDVYGRILDAIPPAVFFAGGRDEHWAVPSGIAPMYSRLVWLFVANTLVGDILHRTLNAKFEAVIRDYVQSFVPALIKQTAITLHPSDGRLMLRRPGYDLEPHRDPKWAFVTALMYLARPDDNEEYGTQLYRVSGDTEAIGGNVHYVERSRCELVRTVPFRANSMLVFLNSTGAHGAFIPRDAPAELERYLYQFRLGPSRKMIAHLIDSMPAGAAVNWAGTKTDRLRQYS